MQALKHIIHETTTCIRILKSLGNSRMLLRNPHSHPNSNRYGRHQFRSIAGASTLAALTIWSSDHTKEGRTHGPSIGNLTEKRRFTFSDSFEKGVGNEGKGETSEGNTFPYVPLLGEEKTRILIVEPGEYDDDIICHFKHISSLKSHDYEAISYAWGDPSSTRTISCSGGKIWVTSNLDAALRRLRNVDHPRAIWVDAICINQDNDEEKAKQVLIMRDIYYHAKRVVIWLGEEEATDADAFTSLYRLKAHIDGRSSDSRLLPRWHLARDGYILSGGDGRALLTDFDNKCLERLLMRSWFRRTWVVQEVGSAQDAIVLCGTLEIPWTTLAYAFMVMDDHSLMVNRMKSDISQRSRESIAAMEGARRGLDEPTRVSLFNVLLATCSNECKRTRDKVFAVLGLAKDWRENGGLTPDYHTTTTHSEVFKRFALWDIHHNQTLRILSCPSTGDAGENTALPSWVPNWKTIENPHPFPRYTSWSEFAASGQAPSVSWLSKDENILHVDGFVVDVVNTLGSVPKFKKATGIVQLSQVDVDDLHESRAWIRECIEIATYGSHEFTWWHYKQFWKAMTCGLTEDGLPVPKVYSNYFKKYLKFVEDAPRVFNEYLWREEMHKSASAFSNYFEEYWGQPVGVHFRQLEERDPDFQKYVAIESSLAMWAARRRFCRTVDGRLAFVPKGAAEGDLICVLLGGEVPYVLREREYGHFVVIGECFIDDFMHGEVFSYRNARKREFALC